MIRPPLRIAIAGLGAAGLSVARRLVEGHVPGARLVAVSARRPDDALRRLAPPGDDRHDLALGAVTVVGVAELALHADVVVEALPPQLFRAVAEPAVLAGRTLVPLSVGALAVEHADLLELAERTGATIVVPTGAVGALDLLRAAAESRITSVSLISRKPPASLADASGRLPSGEPAGDLREPVRVFAGTARQAIKAFPANANVAAALSLAGIGLERTLVEIWADPTVSRNVHRVAAAAESASFTLQVEAHPSLDNPRTSRIAGDSVLSAIRALTRASSSNSER